LNHLTARKPHDHLYWSSLL